MRSFLAAMTGAAILGSTAAVAQQSSTPPPQPPSSMNSALSANNLRQYDQFREKELSGIFVAQGYKMSGEEDRALSNLSRQIQGKDPKKALALSKKVEASLRSPGAFYILSALEMQLASKTGDHGLQIRATDRAIASGDAPPAILPSLLQNQAAYALDDNNLAKAEKAYARLVALTPADAEATISLAQIKADLNKPQEAAPLFDRAIALRKSSNQPVPEVWVQTANSVRAKIPGAR